MRQSEDEDFDRADLLPVQQYFDHLMNSPMNDYPQSLKDRLKAAADKYGLCYELIADVVGRWVKDQRD